MEREQVLSLAKAAGWSGLYITWAEPTGEPDWTPCKESLTVPATMAQLERFANLVATEAKREAAAFIDAPIVDSGKAFAAAIRNSIEAGE